MRTCSVTQGTQCSVVSYMGSKSKKRGYICVCIYMCVCVCVCVCVCIYIYAHRYAAAKSLQSCPTLCDPTDSSPPGSPVPGILQARTLEWVAISFSNA